MVMLVSCVSGQALISSPEQPVQPSQGTGVARAITPIQTPIFVETPTMAIDEAVVLNLLLSEQQEDMDLALQQILESGDVRFIAVLIELMRAAQIGLIPLTDYPAAVEALETLSGQQFGRDWPAWIEWYGGSQYAPPPGFTSWKGRLLSRIDPRFAR